MNYKEKYYNLYQFFGGYLNQSWRHIYVWGNEKLGYQPIIRKYKTEFSEQNVKKTIAQLKEVIALDNGFDEDEWLEILTIGLSLGYYPPGDDLTYKEWLEDVLKILEEPMEKTKQEFVPKRIGQ